jgi:hypothetical protein
MKPNTNKDKLILDAIESGEYSVDDDGGIWSHKGKKPRLLKPTMLENGYMILNLQPGGKSVMAYAHRVVALAKHKKQPGKIEVNHIDGDKTNNSPDNLEWVTPSENTLHSVRTGLRSPWGSRKVKTCKSVVI